MALNPFGASLVILTPFYKIAVGKFSLGYEVNQSLKLSLIFSLSFNSSHIFSRVGIQLTDKWQFYKTTQVPSFIPEVIKF